LSRNKKTGKAKHYAFLEFQYAEVAKVAAEAMDGYFMFRQKLDVKVRDLEIVLLD
jgi:nucleolar protein 15